MTQHIVLDIEGTITDIHFVSEVLFPYARQHMPVFLQDHSTDPAVILQLQAVRNMENDPSLTVDQIILLLDEWMAQDRKAPPLKVLQGLLWRKGYEAGLFQGHLYADVLPQLKAWKAAGMTLSIYSSGSEAAQKLLLGYSIQGDITPFFTHFFDTRIGNKTTPTAYANLRQALGNPQADQITFYSDNPLELLAAQQVGFQAVQIQRDINKPVEADGTWACRRTLTP